MPTMALNEFNWTERTSKTKGRKKEWMNEWKKRKKSLYETFMLVCKSFSRLKKPEIEIQGIEQQHSTPTCAHICVLLTSIHRVKQKVHPLLSLRFSISNHNNIHPCTKTTHKFILYHSHRTRYFSLFRKQLHGCCCHRRRCCCCVFLLLFNYVSLTEK